MTLTRKEFFRQAVFSLGRAATEISETLKEAKSAAAAASETGLYDEAREPGEAPPHEADPDKVATADNALCLARSCGCFSCLERCPARAITMLPGIGIEIDPALCTGCGDCEHLCPLLPKAVVMRPRRPENGDAPPLN